MRRMLSVAVAAAIASLIVIPVAAGWAWPADGPVLRSFSVAEDRYAAGQHRGIDIGAALGAPVRAPAAGTVSFAGPVPGGGRAVTILTADGYAITLLQLGSTVVAPGGVVTEGTVVGQVGDSEDAVTRVSHVHLGIRVAADPNGYVDPASLLPARLPVTAPEPEVVAAPEPASALPAVAEPVPPAVSESAVATVPTEVVEAGPAPSNPVAARPVVAEPSRRSATPRVSAASDRAPEARPGAARPAPARSRAPAARPRGCSADRGAQRRLEGAERPCLCPIAPGDGSSAFAGAGRRSAATRIRRGGRAGRPARCDQARPGVGAGERCGRRRSSPVAVAPARRGGGRGWAHGRGRQEGCTYH